MSSSAWPRAPASLEECLWAVRRLFEALARQRPLLLVFEDVHWAEPTLLDLVEQVADRAVGTILILCIARPEVFEERPGWRDAAIELAPLRDQHLHALLSALPGGRQIAPEFGGRLVAIAGGNPLFAEELLAYVDEQGGEALENVPPSIEALLASRFDLLKPDERRLLERAAVVGAEFSREEVTALFAAEALPNLSAHVLGLVGKGLIRPARSGRGEELFRFHHVLVRDVAYARLPKAERAALHERFANSLEGKPDVLDEIVGYHLEQAVRYLEELAPLDEHGRDLAARGGRKLASAAFRSSARGDFVTSSGLLERAASLLPADLPDRIEVLLQLGRAFSYIGDVDRNLELVEDAVEAARTLRDRRLKLHALLCRSLQRLTLGLPGGSAHAEVLARTALTLFQETDDDLGSARAWGLLRSPTGSGGRLRLSRRPRATRSTMRDGHRRASCGQRWRDWSGRQSFGPVPVAEALRACDDALADASADRLTTAAIIQARAWLEAAAGRIHEARELLAAVSHTLDELGLPNVYWSQVEVELLADDPEAAEQALSAFPAWLAQGDKASRSYAGSLLAEALWRQGRYREAEASAKIAREDAPEHQLYHQVHWRKATAKLFARRGEFQEAEDLAHEALRLSEPTDWLNLRGDVLMDLAEVHRLADRPDDAVTALDNALRLYEQKGNVVSARKARTLLEELRETVSA